MKTPAKPLTTLEKMFILAICCPAMGCAIELKLDASAGINPTTAMFFGASAANATLIFLGTSVIGIIVDRLLKKSIWIAGFVVSAVIVFSTVSEIFNKSEKSKNLKFHTADEPIR